MYSTASCWEPEQEGSEEDQRKDHLARRPQDLFLNLPRLMRKMWRSWIKTREGLLDQFHLSQAPHLGGEVPPKKNNLSTVSISLIYWLRSMNPQKQNYYTPSSLPTHWCQNMNKYLPSCKLTCRLLSCNVPASSAAAQPAPMLAHAPPMTHYAPWATRAIFQAQTHPMLHNVPYPHQWAPLPYSCHLPQMEPNPRSLTSTFGHPRSQFGLTERTTMAHSYAPHYPREDVMFEDVATPWCAPLPEFSQEEFSFEQLWFFFVVCFYLFFWWF